MAWFKIDDGFYSHRKVIGIPRTVRAEAIGTWILCGTWSADKLTDGRIEAFMIDELGGSVAGARALVDAGLWRETADGFRFVNWKEYQPTRSQVMANRKAERDRKADYRNRTAQTRGKTGQPSDDVPSGQQRNPNTPTRPDPTPLDNSSTRDNSQKETRSPVEESVHNTPPTVDNYVAALAAVEQRLGIARLDAGVVVDWILERAKAPPKMPRRYVMTAITRDWAVWERYATEGKLPE